MRAAKVDANQALIVKALRAIGAAVFPLHRVGQGCPDLLVCGRNRTLLIECKVRGEKINKTQAEFIAKWPGEVHIVYTPEEAIKAVTSG
jgi:hypothetical protein